MGEPTKKRLQGLLVEALEEEKKLQEELGLEEVKIEQRVCLCLLPLCAKCLGSHCENDSCSTHTKELKEQFRRKWGRSHGKPLSSEKKQAL